MNTENIDFIQSEIGKHPVDAAGSPVGVVRMDPEKSYAGVGDLLRSYITQNDAEAWEKICKKIDYTFANLDLALSALAEATGFIGDVTSRVDCGQKLLFKPNLVNPSNIDPQTNEPGLGSTACTEWPFMAALMRWFYEKCGISYYRMCIGDAATAMSAVAGQYTAINNRRITTEAVIEGKSEDFHGGWGFYFVRKYLSDRCSKESGGNPMNGFEESVSGTYIPPGKAADKLMVYDLNRIFDDPSKGRRIGVKDGVNYDSIMLHKVIVGGDPEDANDREDYPGCILVNVPKFKVHVIALFTNVIKNLGIGLYPMQYASRGAFKWDYSAPHRPVPGMKAGIPHQVWVSELDEHTLLPKVDDMGNAVLQKTGGITATMIDIIRAVKDQQVYMIHVVDAVEGINIDHQGIGAGTKEPEGMVFAGIDPVATDLLSARYMFGNTPLEESLLSGVADGYGGLFPQSVIIPVVEGSTIVSKNGYDCPISRDICFKRSKERGLGDTDYHVIGRDGITDKPLVSVQGHLGIDDDGRFSNIITNTLYFDMFKMPWDLQKTALAYFEAIDRLSGSGLKQDFLSAFDEDKNGIVTYEEMGKKGEWTFLLHAGGEMLAGMAGLLESLRNSFKWTIARMKVSDAAYNVNGSDFMRAFGYGTTCTVAFQMSMAEEESPDPFIPGLTWGKGKWPGFELAKYASIGFALFGREFPGVVSQPSLYYSVLRYADLTQNQGKFLGGERLLADPEDIHRYVASAGKDHAMLDFTLYVPEGYDMMSGIRLPNVTSTTDSAIIFTASFNGGREIWA
ncbi:MAG: DUF362 domain-containing protein [Desulfobacterales bacterium]